MASKQTKEKSIEWNVGQPLIFPVIRTRIQRAAKEAVDDARESKGKASRRKKK